MRITFDPVADAIYVRVSDPGSTVGETTVAEDGVIVDTDPLGRTLGYELLSVRWNMGATLDRIVGLPKPVRENLENFVESGMLESEQFIERDYR